MYGSLAAHLCNGSLRPHKQPARKIRQHFPYLTRRIHSPCPLPLGAMPHPHLVHIPKHNRLSTVLAGYATCSSRPCKSLHLLQQHVTLHLPLAAGHRIRDDPNRFAPRHQARGGDQSAQSQQHDTRKFCEAASPRCDWLTHYPACVQTPPPREPCPLMTPGNTQNGDGDVTRKLWKPAR